MIAERLRKSILQAAIQGKLTEQLPEDGDAKDLLVKIQAEKAQLIKNGKIKKEKALSEITEEEIPFEIPENWCWVRLGEVCKMVTKGSSPKWQGVNYCSSGVLFVTSENVGCEKLLLDAEKYVDLKFNELQSRSILEVGDVLTNIVGASIGRATIFNLEENANINQAVALIRLIMVDMGRYIVKYLNSPLAYSIMMGNKVDTARANISLTDISNFIVPLPPFAEQQRIVEKIEELLPQLEKLEKDEIKLDVVRKSFPKKMKDSLLQSAIQGKLTEQLESDGDARDLVAQIQKEKARLIKEKKIKKEKDLPEITEDEIPFDIPKNWCWVRLGTITYNHGQKCPDQEFTYIDISSINNEKNTLGSLDNVLQPNAAPSRARKIVHKGDVIYATVRPYLHNICVIDRNIEPEPIVSTGFAVVCTPMPILNKYLFRYLLSPAFDSYANDNENSRGVAYPAINDAKFAKALIPLPPLAEQHRIVERLEKLLPLCDALE
ncbi:MAG: hypothetical protein GXY34_10400 [Syntrophomonadaceae bacterium]|nr:hypothetical protein [Syntrophomonadaceae bacterium]